MIIGLNKAAPMHSWFSFNKNWTFLTLVYLSFPKYLCSIHAVFLVCGPYPVAVCNILQYSVISLYSMQSCCTLRSLPLCCTMCWDTHPSSLSTIRSMSSGSMPHSSSSSWTTYSVGLPSVLYTLRLYSLFQHLHATTQLWSWNRQSFAADVDSG